MAGAKTKVGGLDYQSSALISLEMLRMEALYIHGLRFAVLITIIVRQGDTGIITPGVLVCDRQCYVVQL